MKVPSSSRKRYLGGADWCIAALSHGTRELIGRKVIFQVALFLDGDPDGKRLESAFKSFCGRFPLLWGKTARCWSLAPYWRHPDAAMPGLPVRIGRSSLPGNSTRDNLIRHIETLTNRHAGRPGWTVALDTVRMGRGRTVLVFTFDHRLFDAAGSEAFINLFMRHANGSATAEEYPPRRPAAPAGLDQWLKRFRSGRTVNRMMRMLARDEPATLPLPSDVFNRPFCFRVESFSADEAARIRERAYAAAGYMMLTPYLLATAAAAFRHVFSGGAAGARSLVVSVSTARPAAPALPRRLFFNDLSFLYFRFPLKLAAERDTLARELREQLVRQARDNIPDAIEDGNLLMRILPARSFWLFLMRFYRNRLSSFGFTVLGESAITETGILGCRVSDRIHFPMIPVPPGVGLILCQSNGGYHVVLSYIEGTLNEASAAAVMADFRALLS